MHVCVGVVGMCVVFVRVPAASRSSPVARGDRVEGKVLLLDCSVDVLSSCQVQAANSTGSPEHHLIDVLRSQLGGNITVSTRQMSPLTSFSLGHYIRANANSINELKLRGCYIRKVGLAALIVGLQEACNLRDLDLGANDLKQDAVELLIPVIATRLLRLLDFNLWSNPLKTEAAIAVARMAVEHQSLRFVGMESCDISPSGRRLIADLVDGQRVKVVTGLHIERRLAATV